MTMFVSRNYLLLIRSRKEDKEEKRRIKFRDNLTHFCGEYLNDHECKFLCMKIIVSNSIFWTRRTMKKIFGN